MRAPKKKKTKTKNYHFHGNKWEIDFSFAMQKYKRTRICLICQTTIITTKKGNLERHFRTMHSKFDMNFSPKSEVGT